MAVYAILRVTIATLALARMKIFRNLHLYGMDGGLITGLVAINGRFPVQNVDT